MSKEEILELIDELVNRIEGPAKDVFALAVKATLSAAVIQLVAAVLVLGFAAWFIPKAVREKKAAGKWEGDGWLFGNVIVGVMAIIAFVVLLVSVHTLINVQFVALRSLVPGI